MKRFLTFVALVTTCICSVFADEETTESTTVTISPTTDLYVRMGNTEDNSAKTTLEMYTTRTDGSITADFVGLMSFTLPEKAGYKITSASLRLVTERAKGSINIYGFPYTISNSDTYASQSTNITAARATTALVSSLTLAGTSNKAVTDSGASSTLSDWVNTIDLTAYAQSIGSGAMTLLMENAAESTTTSVKVYTSEAEDVTNSNENFTFSASDLKPVLTVVYEETQDISITVGNYTLSTEDYYVFTAGTKNDDNTYTEETVSGYALAMTGTTNTQAIKYNNLTYAATQIWQLEYAGEQTVSTSADATETVKAFYMKNVGTGNYLYISGEEGSYGAYPAFSSTNGKTTSYMFYFVADGSSDDMLHIRAVVTVKTSNYGRNIGHSKHEDGQNLSADNVGSSSNMWIATKVYTVSVTSVGYATFYADEPVTIPDGVTAYVATTNTNSTLTCTAIEDGIIPAENGVVLKASEGSYTFAVTSDTGSGYTNLLSGTSTDLDVTSGSVYTLASENNVLGFYKFIGTTIPAHKAYLNGTTTSTVKGFSIVFSDDETTDIEAVPTTTTVANGAIYNLQGQRVSTPTRGGIYIQNGRKFIAK